MVGWLCTYLILAPDYKLLETRIHLLLPPPSTCTIAHETYDSGFPLTGGHLFWLLCITNHYKVCKTTTVLLPVSREFGHNHNQCDLSLLHGSWGSHLRRLRGQRVGSLEDSFTYMFDVWCRKIKHKHCQLVCQLGWCLHLAWLSHSMVDSKLSDSLNRGDLKL